MIVKNQDLINIKMNQWMKATRCEQRRCCKLIWRNPSASSWAAPPLYCESRVHWWTAPRDRGLGRESGCYHGAERGGGMFLPPSPSSCSTFPSGSRSHRQKPLSTTSILGVIAPSHPGFPFLPLQRFSRNHILPESWLLQKIIWVSPHVLLEKVWVHTACPNLIQERIKA